MQLTQKIGATAVALAAVFSITHASPSFAQEDSRFIDGTTYMSDAQLEEMSSSTPVESDDIYAIINPEVRPGGPGPGYPPHGPGGPGWGPGPGRPPHGPGWGPGSPWGRGVQCRASNMRGMVFYGIGRNVNEAKYEALSRCERVSRRCFMDGCFPL